MGRELNMIQNHVTLFSIDIYECLIDRIDIKICGGFVYITQNIDAI